MKKILALILTLCMVLSLFVGCAPANNDSTGPENNGTTASAEKAVKFRVTHADGSEKDFDLKTSAENLADALIEAGLVEERAKQDGVYDVVDGEKADWNDGEAWWCFSKDGVDLTVGIEKQPIADGEQYEATFKRGM